MIWYIYLSEFMVFYVIMDDGICYLMLSYVLLSNYSKIIVKIFNGDVENIGFELSVSLFVNLWFFDHLMIMHSHQKHPRKFLTWKNGLLSEKVLTAGYQTSCINFRIQWQQCSITLSISLLPIIIICLGVGHLLYLEMFYSS